MTNVPLADWAVVGLLGCLKNHFISWRLCIIILGFPFFTATAFNLCHEMIVMERNVNFEDCIHVQKKGSYCYERVHLEKDFTFFGKERYFKGLLNVIIWNACRVDIVVFNGCSSPLLTTSLMQSFVVQFTCRQRYHFLAVGRNWAILGLPWSRGIISDLVRACLKIAEIKSQVE